MARRDRISAFVATPIAMALCAVVGMPASADPVVDPRPINGVGNNVMNPTWGSKGIQLLRMTPNAYADGFQALAGPDRENARVISNAVVHQDTMGGNIIPDPRGMTDYGWAWGQIIDHDFGLTPTDGPGTAFIEIPMGDPWYDPENDGGGLLPFRRSRIVPGSGTDINNPREQVNNITSYIDASFVYGSDQERADWLRTFVGGRLKSGMDVEVGEILPYNDGSVGNGGGNDVTLWVAGDERTNETTSLACLHTLMVREHNRLADQVAAMFPEWTDEQVYQKARLLLIALVQHITYDEFFTALLGEGAIPAYTGYDSSVDASMATEFSSAAYRVGHTMLSPVILRLDANGDAISHGNLDLRDSFFNPSKIMLEGGMDPVFRGLAAGQMQQVDGFVNDEVRIFLFNEIGSTPPAMDLVALNVQRARDHGLEDYNAIRVAYGLPARNSISEITSNAELVSRLESVYDDVNDIDPFIGMICEDLLPGSSLGETIHTIVLDQALRARDGDRFWYEINGSLSGADVKWIKTQKLSDIIIRNTGIEPGEIQPNVFFVACSGDMDSNLLIDGADLAGLLTNWGTNDPIADLNGDGIVDGGDLAALLTNWGSCH